MTREYRYYTMIDMESRKRHIGELLARVMEKYAENIKRPRKYGLKEMLYPSEIHAIMHIGNNEGASVTELAGRAGVTKGAVSQIVQKLENKGLVVKETDPERAPRVILKLTSKGKIAFYSHEQMHEESDRELYEYLESLNERQLKTIEKFIMLLEGGIDKRNET